RGYPGQDASPPGPADGGGYVHEHAAPGGAGAFGSVDAVTGSDGEDSGGGGGGGFGYIRLLGAGLFDQGAFLSPLPRYQ
ncbi:MAG: hypothetical protein KJO07_16995, partial [Deltaproteobacteria bacterium]|nr:hypothetical protein [Deltaproteobacteria bacterium]